MHDVPSSIAAILAVIALSGCATVVPQYDIPNDQNSGLPTVRSIDDEVTCELDAMLDDPNFRTYLLAGDMVAALQLNLTVNDTGSLAPSFTYTNGLFAFGGGVGLSRSREQNYTETLYFSMKQLDSDNQSYKKAGNKIGCPHNVDTNLAGDLGLRETVALAIQSTNLKTTQELSGTSGEFGGYVNFVVTKNINAVGPTWTLTHFKGPGGLLGLSEVNTDKLQFAFAQASPSKSKGGEGKYAAVKAHLQTITLNQITTQLTFIDIFPR